MRVVVLLKKVLRMVEKRGGEEIDLPLAFLPSGWDYICPMGRTRPARPDFMLCRATSPQVATGRVFMSFAPLRAMAGGLLWLELGRLIELCRDGLGSGQPIQ
jgi:hypothetical protein